MRAMRWAALVAAILLADGMAAKAQESGGAPGPSPGGADMQRPDADGSSRGGQVGGDLGAGGTGPGHNGSSGTDSGSGSSGRSR